MPVMCVCDVFVSACMRVYSRYKQCSIGSSVATIIAIYKFTTLYSVPSYCVSLLAPCGSTFESVFCRRYCCDYGQEDLLSYTRVTVYQWNHA